MQHIYKNYILHVLIFAYYIDPANASSHLKKEMQAQKTSSAEQQILLAPITKKNIKKFGHSNFPTEVQLLIADYAGLNKEIDVKQSVPQLPLMHAILTQDCDQVQILIALGANVNSRSNRHTAGSLSTAIRAYHDVSRNKADKAKAYAIFKYLLTKGVNPNNSTEIETPLQAAATRDSTLPLLQDLLRLPNINLQTQNIYGHSVFDCLQREINQKVINFNYTDGHRKVYTLLKNKIKKDESKT